MTADPNSAAANSRPKLWRNALILLASAALGGVAVALWNRRELTQIQDQIQNERINPASTDFHTSELSDEDMF
jgi:hypothetical protein